jgi:ABC-type uncharacterized transport system ATPase subunit
MTRTPDGATVRITGMAKSYGAVRAVEAVDLTIVPGEVVALLGPNGAGNLLVLDEPTVAMDVGARRDFWAAMRTYTAGRSCRRGYCRRRRAQAAPVGRRSATTCRRPSGRRGRGRGPRR